MDPSPLTRGKLTLTHSLPLPHWLIPAHAGKTYTTPGLRVTVAAYPRSRGENLAGRRSGRLQLGSSQLTRGKRIRLASTRSHFRLIPAHAGKTLTRRPSRSRARAHPRSLGENHARRCQPHAPSGSSPLTRGKHDGPHRSIRRIRLIPAHAGKTILATYRLLPIRAHPRSLGENTMVRTEASAEFGSSPLTRGKRVQLHHAADRTGLIPAHAGKTRSCF